MTMSNKSVGSIGEEIAAKYLQNNNFIIVKRNFYTKFGEIDIIANKSGKLHFIEVKTRLSDIKGKPYEAVRNYKIRHLHRAIQIYLLQNKIKDCKLSLDIISIIINHNNRVDTLDYYENIDF